MATGILPTQPLPIPSAIPEPQMGTLEAKNFLFLIPTITSIALCAFFLPNFGLGFAAGTGILILSAVTVIGIYATGIIESEEDEDSEYGEHLRKNLFLVGVIGPIVEESIFRGGMQPYLLGTVLALAPAAAAACFGPFSVASAISILVTGTIFGALHYANPHKSAGVQAVMASLGGIAFGALSAQYGIADSVAAHIANNSILTLLMSFMPCPSETELKNKIRPLKEPKLIHLPI